MTYAAMAKADKQPRFSKFYGKGKTLKIFIVTGLFADEYDAGSTRPNARHGLSSMQVEIAGFAPA